jgi:hypothetical protein
MAAMKILKENWAISNATGPLKGTPLPPREIPKSASVLLLGIPKYLTEISFSTA